MGVEVPFHVRIKKKKTNIRHRATATGPVHVQADNRTCARAADTIRVLRKLKIIRVHVC